jgi:phosphoglycerol transferase
MPAMNPKADGAASGSARRGVVLAWALPPLVVAAAAWLALGGIRWDLRVPMAYSGDALFYLVQSKSTVVHGWWWNNPSIGAPTGYHALVFAQNTNVDQAIVRIVSMFSRDAVLVVNIAWLVMLSLSALTAVWGARRLGASRSGAAVAGILFGLTPFALYRHVGHFALVTYLVPVPATVAVLLAAGASDRLGRIRDLAVPLAGCVLLGLNYIYFAFFGAFVIAVGTAVGALRARSWSLVAVGGLCVAAVGLAIALNLVPNAIAWEAYGEPLGVRHVPAEAEYYGLKIRHLIGPAPEHWFPPLRAWAEVERAAEFPYETENIRATLGIVATTGFVWLLVTLVLSPNGESGERRRLVRAAAVVVIAIVLLATVGGFGSLFSLLVTPDIRAYNRISPFIAFLALVVVAFWIDRAWARKPKIQVGVAIAVVAIGLADQLPALSPRRADHAAIAQVFGRTQAFVALLEARLPRDAMVYQLPVRPYPRDPGLETLGVYDQFRPYLSSRQLRWSYPSLTVKQINRERAISAVEESDLPRYLARQGFSAILISRAGYRDRGRQLEDALRQPRAGTTLLASSDDYVALDLRPLSPRTVTR